MRNVKVRRPNFGSSPLARGLLDHGALLPQISRIIPARAGFTAPKPALFPTQMGSSPLARGLREDQVPKVPLSRIIPARAGFTLHSARTGEDDPDHPRSRGVYLGPLERRFGLVGSSPLARGLHPRAQDGSTCAGIIPARAGFTHPTQPTLTSGLDHPRSRGVYLPRGRSEGARIGSSPLARGLRPTTAHLALALGIIPARAGFTRTCTPTCARTRDHPRSRGVYVVQRRGSRRGRGSSPLARGLPERVRRRLYGAWIIPARAGFTPTTSWRSGAPWDHPRSRGVYSPSRRGRSSSDGSSPLARGLLVNPSKEEIERRIIPARAGFTTSPTCGGRSCGDHPRSRGVYSRSRPSEDGRAGSSPLARGLHGGGDRQEETLGIIPARAGFTRRQRAGVHGVGDHPRSRGVYDYWVYDQKMMEGSSPLARGLLSPSPRRGPRHGIIPARAGFTRAPSSPRRTRRDHPRSRGVYAPPS